MYIYPSALSYISLCCFFFRPYFLSAEKGIPQWKERENSLGHTYSDRQGEEETYKKKKKNGLGPRLIFFQQSWVPYIWH